MSKEPDLNLTCLYRVETVVSNIFAPGHIHEDDALAAFKREVLTRFAANAAGEDPDGPPDRFTWVTDADRAIVRRVFGEPVPLFKYLSQYCTDAAGKVYRFGLEDPVPDGFDDEDARAHFSIGDEFPNICTPVTVVDVDQPEWAWMQIGDNPEWLAGESERSARANAAFQQTKSTIAAGDRQVWGEGGRRFPRGENRVPVLRT